MNPELAKKILDAIASGDEKAQAALLQEIAAQLIGGGDTEMPPADPAAAAADPPQPNPSEPAAAASKEIDEMLAKLAKLEADAAARDAKERATLVAELVKLGVETPATAFKAGKIVARLTTESLDEMRARVETLRVNAPRRLTPPESGDAPEYSPRVQAALAKMNPVQKARFEKLQANSYAARKGIR